MRDVSLLVWVGLLMIGVVGSMVSSLRRQGAPSQFREQARAYLEQARLQAGKEPPAQGQPQPTPVVAQPPRAPRAPVAAPPSLTPELPPRRRGLFRNKRDVVRGIIAAEVFGKPRAFGDEYRMH